MQLYKFCWGNNSKRCTLKGRVLRRLVNDRGNMRSCLVEFLDNKQMEIVDLRAIRRIGNGTTGNR